VQIVTSKMDSSCNQAKSNLASQHVPEISFLCNTSALRLQSNKMNVLSRFDHRFRSSLHRHPCPLFALRQYEDMLRLLISAQRRCFTAQTSLPSVCTHIEIVFLLADARRAALGDGLVVHTLVHLCGVFNERKGCIVVTQSYTQAIELHASVIAAFI